MSFTRKPPYDFGGAAMWGRLGTAAATISQTQRARRSGLIVLTSTITIADASDVETASVVNDGYCALDQVPAGGAKTPFNIYATFQPAVTTWSGIVDNEAGESASNVTWDLLPYCRFGIRRQFVELVAKPVAWRRMRDAVSTSHSWGPLGWPTSGKVARAHWTYNGALPPGGEKATFDLEIGVRSFHVASVDDVSLFSSALANFRLAKVFITFG